MIPLHNFDCKNLHEENPRHSYRRALVLFEQQTLPLFALNLIAPRNKEVAQRRLVAAQNATNFSHQIPPSSAQTEHRNRNQIASMIPKGFSLKTFEVSERQITSTTKYLVYALH